MGASVGRGRPRRGRGGHARARVADPHSSAKTVVDERRRWLAGVQATLLHHGIAGRAGQAAGAKGREFLAALELPAAARQRIEIALALIEALDRELAPLERQLPSSPAASRAVGR